MSKKIGIHKILPYLCKEGGCLKEAKYEFTDADEDGIHIKGLIISIFQHEWPSLIKRNDFIYALKTLHEPY